MNRLMIILGFIGLGGCLILIMLTLFGCASATVYDAKGKPIRSVDSFGMFRDIEYSAVAPDGTRETLSSKSTTSDIVKATTEFIGTVGAVAEKGVP